jgi:NAD+ synthase (glutamine-hydrolysing)
MSISEAASNFFILELLLWITEFPPYIVSVISITFFEGILLRFGESMFQLFFHRPAVIQCERSRNEQRMAMKRAGSEIRVGLAQVNPTVGDLDGNLRIVRRIVRVAKQMGVQLLAFPELMLSGYAPEDLLLKPRFLADCGAALDRAAGAARGIVVLLGGPEPSERPGGKPYNTCFVLSRGRVTARYRKLNLPNYGVFDEKRYFEAGDTAVVLNFGWVPVGISVCEDMWMDDGPTPDQVCYGGAQIIVNISASPYHRRKGPEREKLMQRRARENGIYLCYLNLLGGQDELVFDGSSVVVSPRGRTIARGRPFEEDLIVADIPVRTGSSRAAPVCASAPPRHQIDIYELPPLPERKKKVTLKRRRVTHPKPDEEVYRALVLGTRDYAEKNGFTGVVLGISGGIDSALAAAIAVDALGAERVRGVTMPSQYTSKATLRDSWKLAGNLGIALTEIPIDDIYHEYLDSLNSIFPRRGMDVTEENIQARIRGNILMALSNKFGCLVLTTGNKSEVAVGYCTLYGDTAGGFSILKDVPKTLVYALARYRNRVARKAIIPTSIIRRRPTAELRPGQVDQDTLPPYRMLDRIIELYVERDMSFDEIAARGIDRKTLRHVIRMIDRNEYKRRQAPPGIKITPKAFGRDRRLPITNRYIGTDRK